MNPSLSLLATTLKGCPTQDERVTEKRFIETWSSFRQITPEHGDTVTTAMLAGVILYDPESFASLLTAAEQEQLISLGLVALERYQKRIHPANPLGKTIVAALKKETP